MNPNYKPLVNRFEQLSDGDRSCVFAMLDNAGSAQLTSAKSAHDQFYQALGKLGWAERQASDPELAAIANITTWELTDDGRQELPGFLFASHIHQHEQEYTKHLPRRFAVLSLKFIVGYLLVQIPAGFVAYGLTKAGVDLSPVRGALSVGLIFASCFAGVFAALTIWRMGHGERDATREIGALEAIKSKGWLLCLYLAAPVFVAHFALEQLREAWFPGAAAQLVGTPGTRAAIMTALVVAGCWIFVPIVAKSRISSYFGKKRD